MIATAATHLLSCALDPRTHHTLCALTGNGKYVAITLYVLVVATFLLVLFRKRA